MRIPNWFLAEFIGTFILVFGGLGSVALAVAAGVFSGLFQVAAVWGLSLSVAIYVSASISGAHLNPAITLAFAAWSDFPAKRILPYIAAQLLGAFVAASTVYLLHSGNIQAFESTHAIERGVPGSEASAMLFGEYFPNPEGAALSSSDRMRVSHAQAFGAEFLGTLLLALAIFAYTHKNNSSRPDGKWLAPIIGATLCGLICLFAPISMGGFNPARDFAPRLFSYFMGWGEWVFKANEMGWLTVYIIAPILGAQAGAILAHRLFHTK